MIPIECVRGFGGIPIRGFSNQFVAAAEVAREVEYFTEVID